MDPEKIFKFLTENLVDWWQVTLLTLAKPIARFDPAAVSTGTITRIVGHGNDERQLWIHPKLISFAIFSIVIGLSINSLIPGRIPAADLLPSVILIVVYWLMYGSILHLLCRMLRGRGSYIETLSVSLQVLATLYVFTSFLALVLIVILNHFAVIEQFSHVPIVGDIIADDPTFLFFVIGTALLTFYIPLSLRALHKFGWVRTALIAVVPLCSVWISISMYIQVGVLQGWIKFTR